MNKQQQAMTFVKVLTLGIVLIVLIFLTACAKPKPANRLDPIANAKELGQALGCVMAPSTCPKTPEQKAKEEADFQKEFKKIDEQLQKESKSAPKQ